MLMNEFVSRFAAKNEKSFLFEILRRVGGLDRGSMVTATSPSTAPSGWIEWPPADDPGSSGSLRIAEA
jgi:hypothetical protein